MWPLWQRPRTWRRCIVSVRFLVISQTSSWYWLFCEVFLLKLDSVRCHWPLMHGMYSALREAALAKPVIKTCVLLSFYWCVYYHGNILLALHNEQIVSAVNVAWRLRPKPNYAALSLLLCQRTTLWWNMLSTVMHMQHVALCGRASCTREQQANSLGFHHHHLEHSTCRLYELCR